ncbi:MAG TPA: replication-associated recombination protein A [Candidatus Aphodocola excrementigallinarum]|uniref:Replication-associated recombination protein A n=1 Tax=Candidatus Aphodocola excrementigallinarum TaxID=2840670 RepID=A0A9D1IQI6_9FIRM|nr:replication-associated recombination protein A [Candidatus Aphodocola excrementigallinarum]
MNNEPLANYLRPKKLDDVIGQEHLIGKDKIITNLVKNKKIFSMILYGPPGVGKTSIANAIVNELNLKHRFLNAVVNNKKDFEIVFEETKIYGNIVLVVDEIHRLNKDKQDLLLPLLENGLITLIGLTTSNPYHKINPAIRSRCQIFELLPLSKEDIKKGLKKTIKSLPDIKINDKAINLISIMSNGDFRFALNLLEVAYYASDKNINEEVIKRVNSKASNPMDEDETGHYDVLSAFQKSIRGSDVNAALHYLARLISSGDLDSIYRRMSVIAYEDIGLANPNMGVRVNACINACERIGLPEARIPLSQMIIDLCLSPKSNSAESAIDLALSDIEKGNIGKVPTHINAQAFGYKYPHDYPGSYVVQQYLPDELKNRVYYKPKNNKYERVLKTTLDNIEKLKSNESQ